VAIISLKWIVTFWHNWFWLVDGHLRKFLPVKFLLTIFCNSAVTVHAACLNSCTLWIVNAIGIHLLKIITLILEKEYKPWRCKPTLHVHAQCTYTEKNMPSYWIKLPRCWWGAICAKAWEKLLKLSKAIAIHVWWYVYNGKIRDVNFGKSTRAFGIYA